MDARYRERRALDFENLFIIMTQMVYTMDGHDIDELRRKDTAAQKKEKCNSITHMLSVLKVMKLLLILNKAR